MTTLERPLTRLQQWQQTASPWKQTVVESLLFVPLSLILGVVLSATHLGGLLRDDPNLFSSPAAGQFLAWFLATFFSIAVLGPISEELVFRGIPLAVMQGGFWKESRLILWTFGLVSSLIFALVHTSVHTSVHTFHFALPQFLLGLMAWRAANLRGLRHAIFLHFWNNFVVVLILALAALVSAHS